MTILSQTDAHMSALLRGYSIREMTNAEPGCPWRCQILESLPVTRAEFSDGRGGTKTHDFNPLRLVAFGPTWADAVKQMEGRR